MALTSEPTPVTIVGERAVVGVVATVLAVVDDEELPSSIVLLTFTFLGDNRNLNNN